MGLPCTLALNAVTHVNTFGGTFIAIVKKTDK